MPQTQPISIKHPVPISYPRQRILPSKEGASQERFSIENDLEGKNIETGNAKEKSAMSQMLDKNREEQMDMFMKMFITQLNHQDPMDPMDPNKMVIALSTFSSMAQQARMADLLEKINDNQIKQHEIYLKHQAQNTKGYLNKEIDYHGDEFTFDGKPVKISFELPVNISSAKLAIKDSFGEVVSYRDVNTSAGKQTIEWDGIGDSGLQKNGQYQATLIVLDEKQNERIAPLMFTGTVNEIGYDNEGDEYALLVGGTPVSISDVARVRKAFVSEANNLNEANYESPKMVVNELKNITEEVNKISNETLISQEVQIPTDKVQEVLSPVASLFNNR